MAPKGSRVSASASGVGDPNFGFVMSVFKNCEQVNLIKPDWNEVAKESGIKHVQNASSKLKSIVEHHGLVWERNSIKPGDGGDVVNPKDTDGEPKTPKGRARKRKADADGEGNSVETPGSAKGSAKKGKKSQPVVKSEDEGSEVEEAQVKKRENGDDNAEGDGNGASKVKKEAKNEHGD